MDRVGVLVRLKVLAATWLWLLENLWTIRNAVWVSLIVQQGLRARDCRAIHRPHCSTSHRMGVFQYTVRSVPRLGGAYGATPHGIGCADVAQF